MSSNTYPKITIRKISPTISGGGGGQSLLSPRMIAVNPRGMTTTTNNQFCYLLPTSSTSLLRGVTSTVAVNHPTIVQKNPQTLPTSFGSVNTTPSISIRIGDRSGLVRTTISPVYTSPITVSPRSSKIHSNKNNISIIGSLQTSLLSPSDDKMHIGAIKTNKRAKKIPIKYKEESLLQSPPQKTPKTPKTPRTPRTLSSDKPKGQRGRKRKLESLLEDPNGIVEASIIKEKKKKGRKPKNPAANTPGMKKTKSRTTPKSDAKEKKNRTSLVPVSRVSQIMRSVPSLTTLKPDAIAVAVHAAELFVKLMIEKTLQNSKDSSVLDLKCFQEYVEKSTFDFMKIYAPKKISALDALTRQKAFLEAETARRLGLNIDENEIEEENDDEEEEEEGEEEEEDGNEGDEEEGEDVEGDEVGGEEEDEEEDDDDEEEEEEEENADISEGNDANDDEDDVDDVDVDDDDEDDEKVEEEEEDGEDTKSIEDDDILFDENDED